MDVIVDDGTPTSIEHKGDGVKSLAALAMLKDKHFIKAASIIAIEEPEVHLHPSAIHQLIEVILGLSGTNQVILTTHNPLFVSRNNIKSNIIVDRGNAAPAKNIKEISDNLINSNSVLVVEGEDDKISLLKILPAMSDKIKKALANSTLVIEEIGGAGNLSYKLNMLRNFLCNYHVLMDNDKAGVDAAGKANKEGLLSVGNTLYTICNGMPESEFEDCLNPDAYKDAIVDTRRFGVNIKVPEFRGTNKWSDRMRDVFLSQAKRWDEGTEKQVKQIIANTIPSNSDIALNQHKRSSIDALVAAVETMIK
jgi:putative ATP-dependent endonuclease of OLD family